MSGKLKKLIMREKMQTLSVCSVKGKAKDPAETIFVFICLFFMTVLIDSCTKSVSYDPSIGDPLKAGIKSVIPPDLSGSAFVDPVVAVNFKDDTDPAVVTSASITLKKGTTVIPGAVTIAGSTASFAPETDLESESEYIATVKTSPKNITDLSLTHEYTWRFTTGKHHRIDSLSVVSVSPLDKTMGVPVSAPLLVAFNQEISSSMKSGISITLKKGTSTVAGTLVYSGKTATFQPSASLLTGSVYTGNILISSGHINTDDKSGKSFSWSFTTAGVAADVTAPLISSVVPANNSVSAATGTSLSVSFSEAMNPGTVTSSTFTLKQGSVSIPGVVSCSGTTATFAPSSALIGNTLYTATISTGVKDLAGNALAASYVWSFKTASVVDVTAPVVSSVVPANAATTASTTTKASVTFSETMNASTINASTFTLKQGSSAVAGTVSYSGLTASFIPTVALTASTVYTATITAAVTDAAGNALAANYTWSFTTAAVADVTPPAVLSSVPVSGAVSISASSKVTATFSETMDATTINSSTFTLKQGTASVAGTVSYTGTTATFSPSVALAGNTVYSATVTTGAKDVSGNQLAANYTWSFTTAIPSDVTAPSIISVTPANNGTSVAVNSTATAVFSESMNAGLITASTFTMTQGTTAVAGTVTYSGTTATFTPSAALAGGTVYTCTVTTGVKDLAGNAMAANYTWSFTTVADAPAGKSFSADVVPILNICNTCHTHPWTPSTNASTFYSSLVSGGYVNTTTPTSGKIYTKLSGGHPPGSTVSAAQVTTILTWITEGSKNN
jgi:hypothetical protein